MYVVFRHVIMHSVKMRFVCTISALETPCNSSVLLSNGWEQNSKIFLHNEQNGVHFLYRITTTATTKKKEEKPADK